jgi:hypothetical protein
MFYCLRDPDTGANCKSSVIGIKGTTKGKPLVSHYWDEHQALDGFDCDLELELYLEVGILVERVMILRSELIYESDVPRRHSRKHSIEGLTEPNPDPYHRTLQLAPHVSINYTVRRYDYLSQIHLYFVAWKVDNAVLDDLIKKKGHKITVSIDTTYLGRPQLIFTTKDQRRTLRWLASEETPAFEGIPPRGDFESLVEEHKDLIILKWEIPPSYISPRAVTQHSPQQWDHDHYSNPTKRLPCVQRCENTILQIYNFRFMPPSRVKRTIRWGKFIAANLRKSNSIQFEVSTGLYVFIKFKMYPQHAEIEELTITANDFNETLLLL